MTVSSDQIQRIAGFEINGAILFYRMPLRRTHPEAGGVITRWENFATQIYMNAFTAVLNHV